MVLFTSGRKLHLGRRWGREHRRIGAGVVREAREERAGGGGSKKAGSGRNYAVEKGLKGVSQEKGWEPRMQGSGGGSFGP